MIEIKKGANVLFSDHPSYFKILFFFVFFFFFNCVSSSFKYSFIKMFNSVHVWLKVQSFSHADKIKDLRKCNANKISLKLICQVCKLACFNDSLHPNSWNNLKAFFFLPFQPQSN